MSRHVHLCDCGAELVCGPDHDRCAVIEPWTCPSCDLDQWDQRIADDLLNQTRNELTEEELTKP